jgi:GAF domain-containing protein/nitrogen-specific signal transduction histidine kinase
VTAALDAAADLRHTIAELRGQLDAALARETAAAEVLQVINSSPGDLAPVFDAILDRAHRLCGAERGTLFLFDGETLRAAATHGYPQEVAERLRRGIGISETTVIDALLAGERLVHNPDLRLIDDPVAQAVSGPGGVRTNLLLALRTDDRLLGLISCNRTEVRPFSDKEIALLQKFAAQAVIAIENARLLTETREALDQQTATAEVLQAINASPGDLAPVFDAMLEKGCRLCEAQTGHLFRFENGAFIRLASHGVPQEFDRLLPPDTPLPLIANSLPARMFETAAVVHVRDLREDRSYRLGAAHEVAAVAAGIRTVLFVPLTKEGAIVGHFSMHRMAVRPFSEKQIALLQNFAAQAVIAMENARLLTETRASLERQTATSDILRAIAAAPGEAEGTLRKIAETTARLFAASGVTIRIAEGDEYVLTVHAGRGAADLTTAFSDPAQARQPVLPQSLPGTVLRENRQIHLADLDRLDPEIAAWPGTRILRAGGARSLVGTPLRRKGRAIGSLNVWRDELRPFAAAELELLQSFADQAAIAIENARLINETREALEQQTATAEVLQVINSSPGDLTPVFDAILDKAHDLCGATRGTLFLFDGETFRAAAAHGYPAAFAESRRRGISISESSVFNPLLAGAPLIHHPDLAQLDNPVSRATAEQGGVRTELLLPLRKDGVLLGMISCNRTEVRPFTDKEIALLQNFAAQAVIAMENARLLTETREALEQQTATAEVLQVINSSPGDLAPVFEAMLDKAMRLCEAAFGQLAVYEEGRFRTAATRGMPAAFVEYRRQNPPDYGPGTQPARLLAGEHVIHVPDLVAEEVYKAGDPNRLALVDLGGVRSSLMVPLRREDAVLGFINIYRQEPRPFSDKQITLLESFAAQAVIAMDNARLLDEIRQRQAELRVTFDNMGDGVAMFDAELRLAAWNMNFQQILDLPDTFVAARPGLVEYIRYLAAHGEYGADADPEAEVRRLSAMLASAWAAERTRPDGRIIEVRHNPVPGGGFVLIYSDVTARKQAEAEIRSARDAAERALGELQATQSSLIQAQKMAALGQLTAGIAHEIKNPLNFVNNFAGLSVELLDELKATAAPALATLDDDARADIDEVVEMLTGNLGRIAEHGRRADNIVKSMLEHSRGGSGERRRVDLNGLVEEALNLAYHGARAQDQNFNITLERDLDPAMAPVELAPQEMTRVLLNLIGNGFYATAERRRGVADTAYSPALKVATRDLGEAVEIRVRDNGMGIAPEIRDKLFQPFFTTKPTGEGTGLGLSISWDIVAQQHGGVIEVDSRPGEFTEFTIRLPRPPA